MMNKILWQPEINESPNGVQLLIDLDYEFARKAMSMEVSPEIQRKFNELINEDLKKFNERGIFRGNMDPYVFYGKSPLIGSIQIANNCVCLHTTHDKLTSVLRADDRNLSYYSHNVDRHDQAYTIIRAFDKWFQYADALLSDPF